MRTLVLISLLLINLPAAAATVYKWTDRSGRVHYGDRPTQGAELVDVRPSSGDGGAKLQIGADAAARAAACDQERRNLEQLKTSVGIRLIDKEYKIRDYTPDERDQYIMRSEKRVQELCSPSA